MENKYKQFANEYDEKKFLNKLSHSAGRLANGLLTKVLTLWFTLRDSDTPTWAKTVILGTLGYFIMPMDAIPDFLPMIGYSDDLTALISASAMIWANIKPEHIEKANNLSKKLFK